VPETPPTGRAHAREYLRQRLVESGCHAGGRTDERDAAAVVRVLERGHIDFAYRPRVDAPAAPGFEDVQRLYVILSAQRRRPTAGRAALAQPGGRWWRSRSTTGWGAGRAIAVL
jgi:hypothetical protein